MTEVPEPLKPPAQGRNKWGCGLFLVPLVFAVFFAFLESKHWHPSDKVYPVQGIDVSHHQGEIDWQALAGQGVDFAYIKATEGGDFVDQAFAANWEDSAKAGIRRGAYHFFTLCRPGSEQADNFIATVPKHAAALPPVVDLEYLGNCATRPKVENFDAELRTFLDKIESHYGQEAVLYLTEEFDQTYAVSKNFDRRLWLRSLVLEPEFSSRPWTIWQASNFRQLRGIKGRVDWNVMRGLED